MKLYLFEIVSQNCRKCLAPEMWEKQLLNLENFMVYNSGHVSGALCDITNDILPKQCVAAHTHRIVEQGKEVRHRLFFSFKTERDQKFFETFDHQTNLRDFSSYTTELKNKMQMNNLGLLISFILLLIM